MSQGILNQICLNFCFLFNADFYGFFQKGIDFSYLTKKLLNPIFWVLSVTKIHVIWQFYQNRSSGTLHKDKNSFWKFLKITFLDSEDPIIGIFNDHCFHHYFLISLYCMAWEIKKGDNRLFSHFSGIIDLWGGLILWIHTAASLFSTIKSLMQKWLSCALVSNQCWTLGTNAILIEI